MNYYPQYGIGKAYRNVNRGSKSRNYDFRHNGPHVVENDGAHYHPDSVLYFPRQESDRHLHPTQKPVDLLRYLIRTYTKEGDLVLDSCAGSGSTLVAAIMERRHYIGFELNKEYYDIAVHRIDRVLAEPEIDFE